jgi:hypothetical protein
MTFGLAAAATVASSAAAAVVASSAAAAAAVATATFGLTTFDFLTNFGWISTSLTTGKTLTVGSTTTGVERAVAVAVVDILKYDTNMKLCSSIYPPKTDQFLSILVNF